MPKTYGTVTTFTAGSVLTAAQLNVASTAVNNLVVPAACKVYNSAAQSIGNTAWTVLTFDSEVYDTDAMHDTSTNTGRITVQTPGMYHFYGTVALNTTSTAGTTRIFALQKNGSTGISGITIAAVRVAPGQLTSFSLSAIDSAQASDYYQLCVYQDSGGAVNTTAGTWTVSSGYVTASTTSDPAVQNFGATWIGRMS